MWPGGQSYDAHVYSSIHGRVDLARKWVNLNRVAPRRDLTTHKSTSMHGHMDREPRLQLHRHVTYMSHVVYVTRIAYVTHISTFHTVHALRALYTLHMYHIYYMDYTYCVCHICYICNMCNICNICNINNTHRTHRTCCVPYVYNIHHIHYVTRCIHAHTCVRQSMLANVVRRVTCDVNNPWACVDSVASGNFLWVTMSKTSTFSKPRTNNEESDEHV